MENTYYKKAQNTIIKMCGNPDINVHFVTADSIENKNIMFVFKGAVDGFIMTKTEYDLKNESGILEALETEVIQVEDNDGKIRIEKLEALISDDISEEGNSKKTKMLCISHPTEYGTIYSKTEMEEIENICQKNGVYLCVNAKRLANALGCESNNISIRDLAKFSDVFYMGDMENGMVLGEAIIIKDETLNTELLDYAKQTEEMSGNMDFVALQFLALLTGNMYARMGVIENINAREFKNRIKEMGYKVYVDSPTNQIFPVLTTKEIDVLKQNFDIELVKELSKDKGVIRVCITNSTPGKEVDKLLAKMKQIKTGNIDEMLPKKEEEIKIIEESYDKPENAYEPDVITEPEYALKEEKSSGFIPISAAAVASGIKVWGKGFDSYDKSAEAFEEKVVPEEADEEELFSESDDYEMIEYVGDESEPEEEVIEDTEFAEEEILDVEDDDSEAETAEEIIEEVEEVTEEIADIPKEKNPIVELIETGISDLSFAWLFAQGVKSIEELSLFKKDTDLYDSPSLNADCANEIIKIMQDKGIPIEITEDAEETAIKEEVDEVSTELVLEELTEESEVDVMVEEPEIDIYEDEPEVMEESSDSEDEEVEVLEELTEEPEIDIYEDEPEVMEETSNLEDEEVEVLEELTEEPEIDIYEDEPEVMEESSDSEDEEVEVLEELTEEPEIDIYEDEPEVMEESSDSEDEEVEVLEELTEEPEIDIYEDEPEVMEETSNLEDEEVEVLEEIKEEVIEESEDISDDVEVEDFEGDISLDDIEEDIDDFFESDDFLEVEETAEESPENLGEVVEDSPVDDDLYMSEYIEEEEPEAEVLEEAGETEAELPGLEEVIGEESEEGLSFDEAEIEYIEEPEYEMPELEEISEEETEVVEIIDELPELEEVSSEFQVSEFEENLEKEVIEEDSKETVEDEDDNDRFEALDTAESLDFIELASKEEEVPLASIINAEEDLAEEFSFDDAILEDIDLEMGVEEIQEKPSLSLDDIIPHEGYDKRVPLSEKDEDYIEETIEENVVVKAEDNVEETIEDLLNQDILLDDDYEDEEKSFDSELDSIPENDSEGLFLDFEFEE